MAHPLEIIKPKSLKYLSKHLQDIIRKNLWAKILLAMALGVGVGILLGPDTGLIERDISTTIANWLSLPGKVFLGLIQMIVVPLVFASIIRGIASSENMEQLQKLGVRLVAYFLITTMISISIGLAAGMIIKPGRMIDMDKINVDLQTEELPQGGNVQTPDNITGIIENLLPENPLGAMVHKEMLQVVIFSIIIGLALVVLSPADSKPLLVLFSSIQEVCMTVVEWAMKLAPFAVFGLLANVSMKTGIDAMLGMAVYVATVLLGLLVLMCVYLLIVFLVSGKGPAWMLPRIREVQLLAFSTSSSAAVMPASIETAENKLGVKQSISQFLIPLGATINMDGTALYQGVATVFLAQVYGVELGIAELLLIVITAVGASIGSPATPGVGIVILSMVLGSVGIPPGGIALIIGVDRILDMSRTSVNVTGDLTACMVMDRWVGGEKNGESVEKTDVVEV